LDGSSPPLPPPAGPAPIRYDEPDPLPDPGIPLQPTLQYRVELNMSRSAYAYPRATDAYGSRWLGQLNPLSPISVGLSNPAGTLGSRSKHPSYQSAAISPMDEPIFTGNNASAGPDHDPAGTTPTEMIIHEFLPANIPPFSIAQLQHANLSLLNLNPAYAVGNSSANVYVPRSATSVAIDISKEIAGQEPLTLIQRVHDLSYILNRDLWDNYFFSTIPKELTSSNLGSAYHLPNSRYLLYWPSGPSDTEVTAAKTTTGAAAHLMISGGFNINSTSIDAWRALLSSHLGVETDPSDPATPATLRHPYSRFVKPTGTPNDATSWEGYRILSDEQIEELANNIKAEVVKRGPFLSLADFVNRRLGSDETSLKGPLQSAIDATDAHSNPINRINSRSPFDNSAFRPTSYAPGVTTNAQKESFLGGLLSTSTETTLREKTFASRAAFAPGYFSQADLLTALGPVITNRSDTFIIRTYGDVKNPATNTIEAKAWCEAVVQRLPEYIVPKNGAIGDAPETWPATNPNNQIFGRRFQVVSFRWLSPNDI